MNYYAAQATARRIAEQTGMSMADIASLDIDEFARLSGRPTPAEAARAAFRAQDTEADSPATESAPQGVSGPESQGIDISHLDPRSPEYAALRQQLGMGGREYGNGIFGAHGSWSDAARAKAGRSAMAGNRNTVEAPRIERAFVNDRIDHRSAAERFSTPGNEFNV